MLLCHCVCTEREHIAILFILCFPSFLFQVENRCIDKLLSLSEESRKKYLMSIYVKTRNRLYFSRAFDWHSMLRRRYWLFPSLFVYYRSPREGLHKKTKWGCKKRRCREVSIIFYPVFAIFKSRCGKVHKMFITCTEMKRKTCIYRCGERKYFVCLNSFPSPPTCQAV